MLAHAGRAGAPVVAQDTFGCKLEPNNSTTYGQLHVVKKMPKFLFIPLAWGNGGFSGGRAGNPEGVSEHFLAIVEGNLLILTVSKL